ncbi:MAG TPA: Sec-independent protein translocase subunit TatA [Micromonosporaceae bacterium]
MGEFKPWHIAILVLVLVVLFGAKRLPTAARSLGQSMRIMKAETKGLQDDDAAAAVPIKVVDRPADLDPRTYVAEPRR